MKNSKHIEAADPAQEKSHFEYVERPVTPKRASAPCHAGP
jgi:hypothetical protein